MKKLFLTLFIFATFSTFGQSLSKLKVFCTDSFNRRASITVMPLDNDNIGMKDFIKNYLVMNGFKVKSETAAKQRVELSNSKEEIDTTLKQDVSIGQTTYVKTDYILTFSYDSLSNGFGTYILGLNGQIVDMANDGEIVATFTYSHGAAAARKPGIVAEALCKDLKNKAKAD